MEKLSHLSLNIKSYYSKKLPGVSDKSILAVINLTAEGGTVPFISRYRKDQTGNLDEVQVRDVVHLFEAWEALEKRKAFVVEELTKQKNLTDELQKQIEACDEMRELEEIYRPYKKKKKTKAKIARDAGLGPLADWAWKLGHGELKDATAIEVKAKEYINIEAGFATYDEVLRGVGHIIVEKLNTNLDLRKRVRDDYFKNAILTSVKTTKFKKNSKFEKYAEFKEEAKKLLDKKASHRYLAMRRGWQEGELKIAFISSDEDLLSDFEAAACTEMNTNVSSLLKMSAKVALTVHVIPSVTNELHSLLKETADQHAIDVFADNLRRVLMGSPFGTKVVLGVDPGLKTGCKLALVDQSGTYISHTVMHILAKDDFEKAKKLFKELFAQLKLEVIAVGNGTGGREAEVFIGKVLKDLEIKDCHVLMVNEAGASVYSASDVARNEFPDLDLTVRGAISIARRLQDPLAELVKIDPKSIGVGQYQHDVPQADLKKSLSAVVESCVNQVGVNLNTASESLLQYVSGIGPAIAKNILTYRKENGLFKERNDLLKVERLSTKAFELSAGFLRVPESPFVLDHMGIHPERYTAVREMAKDVDVNVAKLATSEGLSALKAKREKWVKLVGEYTFDDIVAELEKPGRDPRDPYKIFKFRDDIHEVKDLKEDMICPGIVTNVTNFGAFVDVGVHQDGLVHISHLSHDFVDDPQKVVSPGDQVQVKVLTVDSEKNQISLSMLLKEKPKVAVNPKSKSKARAKGAAKAKDGKFKRDPKKGPRKNNDGKRRAPERPRREKQVFNNPFAALSGLKKD